MLALSDGKTCGHCGKTKPRSEFHRHASKKDGLAYICKDCKKPYDDHHNRRENPKRNAVSRIAYGIAGGLRAFYQLPKPQRLALRDQALRLHGLGLHVQHAAAREASRVREGFVYVIRNDAWPDCLKIGSAVDAESRLGDALTWDPHRRFYVAHSVFVPDRNASERRIHERLRPYRLDGEWFAAPLALARSALDAERETPPAQQQQDTERSGVTP